MWAQIIQVKSRMKYTLVYNCDPSSIGYRFFVREILECTGASCTVLHTIDGSTNPAHIPLYAIEMIALIHPEGLI